MKSLRSRGSFVSSATSVSIDSVPPNHLPVTTEMQGAPTARYCETTSGIVRSPMIGPPSASWRLTSMMIGRSDANSASVKALAILVTSLGPLPPGAADRLDVVIADLTVGATRVGIDVDTEEQRMGDERFVLLRVVRRDPAGQQERLAELVGQRRDNGGIERLPGAAHAAVLGHDVEQENVAPGPLGGPRQRF